jgi:flagellar basal body rod protein FlgF
MTYGINIKKNRKTFVSSIKNCNVSLTDTNIELNPILRKRYPYYSNNGQISHTRPLQVTNGILEKINININTNITSYKS